MTLPDSFPWQTPTSRSTGISSSSVSNDAGVLSSDIDNLTNKDRFAKITLEYSYGTAPTVNKNLKVFFLYGDGTNYEDGGASTKPAKAPVMSVSPTADTSSHRRILVDIPIPPSHFKALVWNDSTGQTAAVTLTIETYREAVVD